MTSTSQKLTWDTALKLGRVSNLPTVWTNSMAGIALTGSAIADMRTLFVIIALSLFYIGGMFLNDACDAEIDAIERPERPIPSGQISQLSVFKWAYGMMGVSVLMLLLIGTILPNGTGIWPAICGVVLAALIVLYNRHHKGNPISPLIMGFCRVLVYLTAGVCFVAALGAPLLTGAALLAAYLIGLTYVAKQENLGSVENMWPLLFLAAPILYGIFLATTTLVVLPFLIVFIAWVLVALYFIKRRSPGDIPRAVVSLIAGISLLDAIMIASTGNLFWAMLAVGGFGLTLLLQRVVSGT